MELRRSYLSAKLRKARTVVGFTYMLAITRRRVTVRAYTFQPAAISDVVSATPKSVAMVPFITAPLKLALFALILINFRSFPLVWHRKSTHVLRAAG